MVRVRLPKQKPRTVRKLRRRSRLRGFFLREDVNFLVTNRIPRRLATRFMGWYSRLRIRWLTKVSIAAWRKFAPDLDLTEAKEQRFRSLHDCFVRELRPGARPVDGAASAVVSPCDAVVGAMGRIRGTELIQAKGFPYTLQDLLGDDEMVDKHRDGLFVTLRLRSDMYHRFHAPEDCRVRRVNYISGDTWNVNPIALRRIEKLFCKNERAVIDLELADRNEAITLVPVAAILVASIKLHCLDHLLSLRYRGSNRLECDATYRRGDEMGYFQHGSTIVLFATGGFEIDPRVTEGTTIRMGTPLLCRVGLPRRAGMDHSNREDR
ncbi:MAG: phosphatidylserine decarboxylase [Planctomycetes bacterium]|nr:phosphatidylserine decarboxylase [Planctomycetota bacterium]